MSEKEMVLPALCTRPKFIMRLMEQKRRKKRTTIGTRGTSRPTTDCTICEGPLWQRRHITTYSTTARSLAYSSWVFESSWHCLSRRFLLLVRRRWFTTAVEQPRTTRQSAVRLPVLLCRAIQELMSWMNNLLVNSWDLVQSLDSFPTQSASIVTIHHDLVTVKQKGKGTFWGAMIWTVEMECDTWQEDDWRFLHLLRLCSSPFGTLFCGGSWTQKAPHYILFKLWKYKWKLDFSFFFFSFIINIITVHDSVAIYVNA